MVKYFLTLQSQLYNLMKHKLYKGNSCSHNVFQTAFHVHDVPLSSTTCSKMHESLQMYAFEAACLNKSGLHSVFFSLFIFLIIQHLYYHSPSPAAHLPPACGVLCEAHDERGSCCCRWWEHECLFLSVCSFCNFSLAVDLWSCGADQINSGFPFGFISLLNLPVPGLLFVF